VLLVLKTIANQFQALMTGVLLNEFFDGNRFVDDRDRGFE
jgi:hypothetical protein